MGMSFFCGINTPRIPEYIGIQNSSSVPFYKRVLFDSIVVPACELALSS
jgi:hypothetical protein